MDRLISELKKRKELILYLVFGVCTTGINIVTYFVLRYFGISVLISSVIAWVVSVLFAYVTNKLFVFECKQRTLRALVGEFLSFVSGRIFTGVLDVVIMLVMVDMLHLYEPIIKILANVIVIVLNYVLSKLWIFRK